MIQNKHHPKYWLEAFFFFNLAYEFPNSTHALENKQNDLHASL